MNETKTVDAFQVQDSDTGEMLEWYGKYLWRGQWFECDEGFATREEAESDALAMLNYLESSNK